MHLWNGWPKGEVKERVWKMILRQRTFVWRINIMKEDGGDCIHIYTMTMIVVADSWRWLCSESKCGVDSLGGKIMVKEYISLWELPGVWVNILQRSFFSRSFLHIFWWVWHSFQLFLLFWVFFLENGSRQIK